MTTEFIDEIQRTTGYETNIAFRDIGNGPAVVLLHGTSANFAVWHPIQEALQGHARIIALDQRGHGRSDQPATGYTGVHFAADIIRILNTLEIDQATLVGHSMGARNAWLAAAFFPERVTTVLSVDYTPFVENTVLEDLAHRVAGGDRSFETYQQIRRYLQNRYPNMLPDAIERRATWGYMQHDDELWRPLASATALTQLIEGLHTPWTDQFTEIRHPMTHIRGSSSKLISPTAWDRAKQARPQDRWVMAPLADHYVPEVTPEIIIDELSNILTT